MILSTLFREDLGWKSQTELFGFQASVDDIEGRFGLEKSREVDPFLGFGQPTILKEDFTLALAGDQLAQPPQGCCTEIILVLGSVTRHFL